VIKKKKKRKRERKREEKRTSELDSFLARLIEPDEQNDLMDDIKIIATFLGRVAHCCQKAEFIGWIESADWPVGRDSCIKVDR